MKSNSTKKLALAGVLCAVAVAGSMFSFPVFASKCAPVQHMVNVLCAVFLGPWYGLAAAFAASLLRNLLGLGSLLAFPGSMCGALLCGLAWRTSKNLCADAGAVAFTAYIAPFLVSTAGGSILAGALVFTLQKSGALRSLRGALEH